MTKYSFKKYQPSSLRLWHWLNAIVIFGLLSTVLLRKTFLSWRTNSALIEEKLKTAGTVISQELAKDIAVSIRNPLWDWHIYLGFALSALIFGRIVIFAFVEKKCPGFNSLKLILGFKDVPPHERKRAAHFAFVQTGYAFFYLATLTMVATGFALNFKVDLGLTKDISEIIKETHELLMWFFVVFIVGHLVGVVIAENGEEPGLVSDMINGGSKNIEN